MHSWNRRFASKSPLTSPPILGSLRTAMVCIVTLCAASLCATSPGIVSVSRGQEPDERSYILMNSGSVFHGVARPRGEQLEIKLGEGNVIQIEKKNVAFIAGSKAALYDLQIKSTRRWGSGEHWYLSQWCIQQGLIEEGIFHFRALSELVDHDAKFKQLELQLKKAILASDDVQRLYNQKQTDAPEKMPATMVATGTPTTPVTKEISVATPTYPAESVGGVELASASTPLEPVEDSSRAIIAKMPGYIKKSFQSNVTPLLVSRCGQAGCHGFPGNSSFHIRQAVGEHSAAVAMENLVHVLRYVNVESPAESQLIAYATMAHGIQRNPSFNTLQRDDDRVHVERVKEWIKSINFSNAPASLHDVARSTQMDSGVVRAIASETPSTSGVVKASSEAEEAGRSRGDRIREWRDNLPAQDKDAPLSKPAKSSSTPPIHLSGDEIGMLETAIDKLEKSHATKSTKDPFDPSSFNSKFGAKK